MQSIWIDSNRTVGKQVKPYMLGGEYLGWTGFPGWQQQAESIGIQHIRWPAGNIAEDRMVGDSYAFDISTQNIVDNWPLWNGNPRPGLSELFTYAIEGGSSLSMIIPTGRYVELAIEDMNAAKAWIQSDVAAFTDRLAAGDFGTIPNKFTLEVGAEYYSTDAWADNSHLSNIDEIFGDVFAEVVSALSIGEQQSGQELYSIAVQMSRFQSDDDSGSVRNGEAADSEAFQSAYEAQGVMDQIDGVIWHRYVYTYDQISHHLALPGFPNYWEEETLYSQLASWTQRLGHELELTVGWASPDIDSEGESESNPFFDYGPRSGANLLQMFSSLVASGADIGTIYGIDSPWVGALSSGGHSANDFDIYFPGSIYGLLTESVAGLSVVEGYENNSVEVDEFNNVVESTQLNINAFAGNEKQVVFLSAGNLPLEGTSAILETEFDTIANYIRVTHAQPTDEGKFAKAFVFDSLPVVQASGGVQLNLATDFEITRIEQHANLAEELLKAENAVFAAVGSDNFILTVTDNDDDVDIDELLELMSLDTRDTLLSVGEGNDSVQGSETDDSILGGGGNDLIIGGAGADVIFGDQPDLNVIDTLVFEL